MAIAIACVLPARVEEVDVERDVVVVEGVDVERDALAMMMALQGKEAEADVNTSAMMELGGVTKPRSVTEVAKATGELRERRLTRRSPSQRRRWLRILLQLSRKKLQLSLLLQLRKRRSCLLRSMRL